MPPLIQALIFIYPILCVFGPCIVYQVILYRYKKPFRPGKIKKWNLLWRYIYILYLSMVMEVVGMGSIWDLGKFGAIIRLDEINLIPLQSAVTEASILNIIMLMPLGFLLPLIWEKYRRLSKTVFTGFLLSFLIEIGQLFNRRASDIDDLIMNTLGALLGFGLWFIFNKIFKLKSKEDGVFKDDPRIYVLLTVAGTFLLFNWRWFIRFLL